MVCYLRSIFRARYVATQVSRSHFSVRGEGGGGGNSNAQSDLSTVRIPTFQLVDGKSKF